MNSSKNRSYQTKCLHQLMKLYPKLPSNFSTIADVCPFKEEKDTPSHSNLDLLDLMKRLNTGSHQGSKEIKKCMLFQKPDFTYCQCKGEECHIFLSGSRISLNIQRIHFQLPCWRDRTFKDIRRLLAIQSERINGECKTRSKYYDRMIWEFCRHGLGFAYLKRQSIPCK